MIRLGIVSALFASVAIAAEPQCDADGVPAGAVELRESIVEITAMGGTFPYMSILAPAAWSAEGAAEFDLGDSCGWHEKLRWRASSPDAGASIEILPGGVWTASWSPAQFSACPSREIFDATAYARSLLADLAPSAALRDTRDRPDLSGPVNEHFGGGDNYAGATTTATAAELSFEGPSPDGGVEHGLLVAFVLTFKPPPFVPEYEMRATAWPPVLARTRNAEPDRGLVEAVRASALAGSRWALVRERLIAPSGKLPDPRKPISVVSAPDFEARETLDGSGACGGAQRKLKTADIWKSVDGRYWYLPPALELRSGNR